MRRMRVVNNSRASGDRPTRRFKTDMMNQSRSRIRLKFDFRHLLVEEDIFVAYAHRQSNRQIGPNNSQVPGTRRDSRLAASVHVIEACRLGGRAHCNAQVNTPELANGAAELPINRTRALVVRPGFKELRARAVAARSTIILGRIPS